MNKKDLGDEFVEILKECLIKRYKRPEIERERGEYEYYVEKEFFSKSPLGTDLI